LGTSFFLISGLKIQEAVPVSGQFNHHLPFPLWQRRLQLPKNIMQNKKNAAKPGVGTSFAQ